MIRSLKWQALLATAYFATMCGCSALAFQRTEPEEIASLPPAEGFGWQQRLARLKERRGEPAAPAQERVASAPKRNKKNTVAADERIASAPRREKRIASSPAEKSLSLGRWVKPAANRNAVRTFDVQKPEDVEPEVAVQVGRRNEKQVEQPVSYDAPEQVAKPDVAKSEVAAAGARSARPPIVERLAPVGTAAPLTAPSGSALPENRLRRSSAVPPTATDSQPISSKRTVPPSTRSSETVPWQQATFRSLDE